MMTKALGYKFRVHHTFTTEEMSNTIQEAHYNRRRRALPIVRRQYNVKIPMALWHIDSYDKLTMYWLRIHGCIDGASHYVLYAQVAQNKTQETLFEPFSAAVPI